MHSSWVLDFDIRLRQKIYSFFIKCTASFPKVLFLLPSLGHLSLPDISNSSIENCSKQNKNHIDPCKNVS